MRNIANQLGISSASIIMALNILHSLYEQEKLDYQTSDYPKLRKNFTEYAQSIPFSNEFLETVDHLQKLRIRFYARLIAYLSTIRQLDENLKDIFRKCTEYHHSKKAKKDSIDRVIEERDKEIERYLVWRDKVFCHLESRDSQKSKQRLDFSMVAT